ncbi:MAG: hypothetical protein EOP06_27520 [Proteobacteria bacterium]|nr:MAG: hypothetical protein EOP06_27520 [Pseudomonadota bacterium]
MAYTFVEWMHSYEDEPTHLYYELDEQRYEQRKVEVFRDGAMQYTGVLHECDSTFLSPEPHPTLEEISLDPEFKIQEITRAEFDQVWGKALNNGN